MHKFINTIASGTLLKVPIVLFLFIMIGSVQSSEPSNFELQPSTELSEKAIEVSVTYVGNAGFLITIGDKKILIDALFKGYDSYELPKQIQDNLTLCKYPFNEIDLILITHPHGDHLDFDMLETHLKNNPKTLFASTARTVELLGTYPEQSISFNPEKGQSESKEINGISIEAFNFPHGAPRPDGKGIINLGYLITVNGITFFQTGDADFDQFTFDEFRSLQLPERKIDLAFIQHYYLRGDSLSTKFVNEAIGGKYIFPIHYHFTRPPFDAAIVKENYPDAIIFKEELQRWNMPDAEKNASIQEGYYYNQNPPGDSAVIFAPGKFSMPDRLESNITFSPDGKECYFGLLEIKDNKASYKIYYSKYLNNKWTEQKEAPFSINNGFSDPVFSADGKKLYLNKKVDIWMLERSSEGWSEAKKLPSPINSDASEGSITESLDGDIYISSRRPDGIGGIDNWQINRLADQSLKAENLGPIMNSKYFDYSPFIAPDGSYLIFGSYRARRDGLLYISFNEGNNVWTTPINMNSCGAKVNNTMAHHSNPSLSPDGKYLFFRRHAADSIMDVYWVSSRIITKLKKKALQEYSSQKFTTPKEDYLGQTPPGDVPVMFAPGIISVDSTVEHGYPTFSPDGNMVFWQSNLRHKEKETEIFLKVMRRVDGQWTEPESSPYGGMPAFSPDGKQLYYLPKNEEEKDLCFITKQGENWSDPKSTNLIKRFPELKYMYGHSVTNDATLYFFAHAEGLGSRNNFGIYRSELINGMYAKPELLPPTINAAEGVMNWMPFIAADESYLLFSSSRNTGTQSLYISFRLSDGSWTEAHGLGEAINSQKGERFPYVSPDGKYLFFTRWHGRDNEDIMWVSSKIIEDIKKEVLNPMN